MKRVRLFHMKMASGGRSKQRDSRQDGGDANGDCPSEDSDAVSKNKSKNGLLKSLRWRWRRSKRVKRVDNRPQNEGHDVRMSANKKFRLRPGNVGCGSVVRPTTASIETRPAPIETRPAPESTRPVEFPAEGGGTPTIPSSRSAEDTEQPEKLFSDDLAGDSGTDGSPDPEPSSSEIRTIVDCHEPPRVGSLTRELFKLSKCGWYWGPITRSEAEEKLLERSDGAFLVRDSSDDRYLLSLSFRSFGKTLHTRIEHCNGLFSFYAQPELEGHTSVVKLIEQSMNYSQSGVFCYSRSRSPGSPSYPVRLTRPVSRFTQVRSLQYLCRFVIRQYTRFDHIQKLPLPSRIKGYLEEGHY